MFEFIDENNLDNIESVLVTLNDNYGDSKDYKDNFFIIVYLLSVYYNKNRSVDKLDFFLSDIATINYLKDKRLLDFIMSLVNTNNTYELSFENEIENFSLLLNTAKSYLDTKRSNYKVLDNNYVSLLIDVYVNCSSDVNRVIREMFFLVLYNNYQEVNIHEVDDFYFELTRVYFNFLNDEFFINHDITDKEKLYNDIKSYIDNNLSNLIKPITK
jgi:hypothetical protein